MPVSNSFYFGDIFLCVYMWDNELLLVLILDSVLSSSKTLELRRDETLACYFCSAHTLTVVNIFVYCIAYVLR